MTERNDTCPCGSGKKRKKCCMKDFTKGAKQVKINAAAQELRQTVATLDRKTTLTIRDIAYGTHKGGFRK